MADDLEDRRATCEELSRATSIPATSVFCIVTNDLKKTKISTICHKQKVEVFWLQHPRCAGEHFPSKFFSPVFLESSSHVGRRSSKRASATSFALLSSVDVVGLPGLCSHNHHEND